MEIQITARLKKRYLSLLEQQIEIIDVRYAKASGMPRKQLREVLELLKDQFLGMVFGKLYDENLDISKPYLYTLDGRLSLAKQYLLDSEREAEFDPIMIVVPEKLVSTSKKMDLLETAGDTGQCDIPPYFIRNDMVGRKAPDSPYILIGLDHGALLLGKTHTQTLDWLKHHDSPNRRYALTADEGAMLVGYHPELLEKGRLVLQGSSYDKGLVPIIELSASSIDTRPHMLAGRLEHKVGLVPSYITRFRIDWNAVRYKRTVHMRSLSKIS